MEDKFNRSETNRNNIILQYYPGYNSKDELYMFLNRDRVSQPDFETWSKSNDWAEILKPWQTEQVQDIREKELSN